MRNDPRALAAALMLVAGGGFALGQQNPAAPSQTSQNTLNPNQNKTPIETPKEGQVVPVSPTGGPGTGNIAAHLIPGASQQTMPSTVSAENAAKDKHPWLDRGPALKAEQKALIYRAIAAQKDTPNPGNQKIFAEVSAVVPDSIAPQPLPADVTAQVPGISDLKYVKAGDQVLLVNPPNNTVAAVITKS